MKKVTMGSHNSWSYLSPRKWWMRLITWTARCQSKSIVEQYNSGVRCFDLRLKRDKNGKLCIAHGIIEYDIDDSLLKTHLEWLNEHRNVKIRVLHEIRKESENTEQELRWFRNVCILMELRYVNIYFFCGRNLVNWNVDYSFCDNKELPIEDAYGSRRKPKTIFALFPWLYAKLYNAIELERKTEKDVLMLDFV